jgi:hypothetical protein
VRLEEVQKFEADTHPLSRRHKLGTTIGDATDQIDGRLLHLLVPIPKNGGHTGY